MKNKFAIAFGQQPESYISRQKIIDNVYTDFNLDYPSSHIYVLSGVRGCGKTVLLTNIADLIKSNDNWIVVDVNPNREILEQIAAGIYENDKVKHLFVSKTFSFSFHGIGFSLEGKEPVSNIKTILLKMLDRLKNKNIKLLITIDEVDNGANMRAFVHDFQSLLREKYEVYSLMTGLFENVNLLQNNKNLTFLYRSPKIELTPLSIKDIEKEYKSIFNDVDNKTINELANLTSGYAFAYQVVGYLFNKERNINKILPQFDSYLKIYSYEKIWEKISIKERNILRCFDKSIVSSKEIMEKLNFKKNEFCVYRDRLIKRGILKSESYGILSIVLPRFEKFVKTQL